MAGGHPSLTGVMCRESCALIAQNGDRASLANLKLTIDSLLACS